MELRRTETRQQLQAEAQEFAGVLRDRILAGREVLVALAQMPDIRGDDVEPCSNVLRRVVTQFDRYSAFSKVDTAGRIICSSDPLPQPVSVADEPNIRRTLSAGTFSVSPLRIGPTSGKPIVVLTQPITDSAGRMAGIIASGLLMTWVTDRAQAFGQSGEHFLVFSSDGVVMADSACGRSCIGTRIADPTLAHLLGSAQSPLPWPAGEESQAAPGDRNAAATITAATIADATIRVQDIAYFIGRASLSEVIGGLHVAAIRPVAKAMEHHRAEMTRNLAFLIIMMLFSILVAVFAARYLVKRWIDRLAETAGRIAEGDLSARTDLPQRGGDFTRFADIFNDMTARIEARDEATRDALVAAKTQAEAANRAKSSFLAMMSHELRTPLNAIIGFARLLQGNEADPDRRSSLEIITDASDNLLSLIDDILDLSKIDIGKRTLTTERFDISSEISKTVTLLRPQTVRKGLSLAFQVAPPAPPLLLGDARAVRQIMINLIGNAIKFTTHGTITVSVTWIEPDRLVDHASIMVSVSDTGIGIPSDRQESIFGVFERGEPMMTREFDGAGLGLAICRRLVALMGGHIWVESALGHGSRFSFTLTLPRAVLDAAAGTTTAPAVVVPDKPARTARILIIEDDPQSRSLLQRLLDDPIYAVTAVETGSWADQVLRHQGFDLLIIDIKLPGLDGLELARRLRNGTYPPNRPDTPILVVTAFAMSGDKERLLASGVDAYLSKPIDADSLLREIVIRLNCRNTDSDLHRD